MMQQWHAFVTHGKNPIAKVTGIQASNRAEAQNVAIKAARRELSVPKTHQLFAKAHGQKPGDRLLPDIKVVAMEPPKEKGGEA